MTEVYFSVLHGHVVLQPEYSF